MQYVFSSTFPSISIPLSLSCGVVRPINHRASAYRLGAPNACQSSDKMDFQFSQGSQTRIGRVVNRQNFAALLPPDFLFVICFSLSISDCVQPMSLFFYLRLPYSVSLICRPEPLENRPVVKVQIPVPYWAGRVMLSQQVFSVSHCFNSGWIFN